MLTHLPQRSFAPPAHAGAHVDLHHAGTHVGASATSSLFSGIALLTAVGLGGGVLLFTASAKLAGVGLLAGLLIGSRLHSESAGA